MKFAIMGTGVMGRGWIAQCAMCGHEVHAYDSSAGALTGVVDACVGFAGKAAKKFKIEDPQLASKTKGNIHVHTKLEDFVAAAKGCDVFFEVIFEDLELKCSVLRELVPQLPDNVYFWSNTSSLNIDVLGEASGRPKKAIVCHGMNPVPLMVGVELVPCVKTSPETVEHARKTLQERKKLPFVAPNSPGFGVNHTSLGHPQGTFKLSDFVSSPTMLRVALEMYQASSDPRLYPPAILVRMVKDGAFGPATGKGFYDWSDPRNPKPRDMSEYRVKTAEDLTGALK
ncbi:MAG: 3-hydroxyacyl-CoA dehydrogenase family protein [Deltaproteobacteria bacterium]|nr:3-hydroxyacyl-CoA dehydrogenase family protein [Deltaproteobacteria bacterium]